METRTLYPGITLHAEKNTRFKTEYLSINFICSGSLFDRPHASILSAVLGRGTRNHPTQADLDKVLADLYDASLYTKGYTLGETFIQPFSLSCHNERFIPGENSLRRKARNLLFEMILEPLTEKDGFLTQYVEDEKKNKMDQLNAEKNNKPSYALSRCFGLLCRGEPYDYPASKLRKELPSVSACSLLEFYQKMLRCAPIEIFYFGEEDLSTLCSDLANHLSPLFTPKSPLVADVVSLPKPQVCREEECLVANQSTLCLGFKTCVRMGMPDFYALSLFKEIFCDSPISLLFTNLREKESLCYYCQGSLLTRKGVYLLEFGIDGQDAQKTEKETLAQLETLKTGNFDEEFLFLCKKSLCDGFSEFYDNPVEMEGWYLRQFLSGSALSPKEVSKKIFNVRKKDVQRVANTLLLDSVFLLYGMKNSKEEKAL